MIVGMGGERLRAEPAVAPKGDTRRGIHKGEAGRPSPCASWHSSRTSEGDSPLLVTRMQTCLSPQDASIIGSIGRLSKKKTRRSSAGKRTIVDPLLPASPVPRRCRKRLQRGKADPRNAPPDDQSRHVESCLTPTLARTRNTDDRSRRGTGSRPAAIGRASQKSP